MRLQCRRPWFDSWVGKICRRRDRLPTPVFLGFLCDSAGKEIRLQCGAPGFNPWVGKGPWRRERLPTPVFWPGEFHGLQSMGSQSWTWLSDFHFHSRDFLCRFRYLHYSLVPATMVSVEAYTYSPSFPVLVVLLTSTSLPFPTYLLTNLSPRQHFSFFFFPFIFY